jgi:antitoxin HicB
MSREKGRSRHVGSSFDDFLREDGIEAQVTTRATRKVIANLITAAMKENGLSKTEMADRMHTSRQALNRLLDPDGPGLTLDTLERAAAAVGKRVRIELEDDTHAAA